LLGEAIHTLERPIAVDLKIVAAPCTPMLWAGCSPPAIVLPKQLVATLSDDALRGVLIHELAHLVRRDHSTNLLAFIATCLVWWHPLAWFARRQLADAAEACCDALAIERLPHLRRTYAETLLMVVDSRARTPGQQSALGVTFGQSHSLRRRFELIADRRVSPSLGGLGRSLLVVAALVLLGLSAWSFVGAATFAAPIQVQPPAASSPQLKRLDQLNRQIFTACCPS
jgi:beta-lactamase regulating signal transducer with metallopeptidase domain